MSKPQPKSNFMQTLLFMVVIFLGFQMWMNSRNSSQAPTFAIEALRGYMVDEAGRIANKDLSKFNINDITSKKTEYERRITSEFETASKKSPEQKKTLQAELDAKKLEAEVLVADTQLKYAIAKADYNTAQTAYTTFKGLEKQYYKNDVWQKPVTVKPAMGYDRTSVTPKELLADITREASKLGKNTPVWGFFPGYEVVDFLVRITGYNPKFSYWLAALFMAICVRAAIYKLFQKQLMWGRQMAQLTPLTAELKEKYSGPELQTKTMELYKEYGINPMAGCLPMLIQMPFFFLIYASMLHYRFEFEKGFFLWIGSGLSDTFPGIVARNLGDRDYPLIVIYAISMVVTQLLTPISDPSNAKQQRLMGLSMTLMFGVMMFFWPIPSAFVLYWIFLNILATAQSLRAYRMPPPPLVKVNAPGGGVFPTSGAPKPAARFGSTGAPKVHRPKKKK